ncbi:hypothetical protein D9M71_109590 [compost metagenome]
MARARGALGRFPIRHDQCAEACHVVGQRQAGEAAHGVVQHVEGDHQFLGAERPAIHPLGQRPYQRQRQGAAGELEQQAAEGHAAAGGVLRGRADQGDDAAAEIGADHQAQRDFQRDHLGRRQGCGEQHGGQAGIGNHGEQGAGQGIQHHIAGEAGEQHLDPLGLGHRRGGGDDQLQGEDDQAEADEHPAELAEARLLAGQEEDHAEEDQQRRQPRQVEGQHPRHQRGPDVGAEHDRQRRRQRHQAGGDEGGDQQGGGVAALHQGGDADPGGEGQRPSLHAVAEHAAQVGAVDAEDAGADDMGAPYQQGHGGEQIEQFQHGEPPSHNFADINPVAKTGGRESTATIGLDVIQLS